MFYSENMGSPSANTDISAYTNSRTRTSSHTVPPQPDKVRYAALPASTGYTGASGEGTCSWASTITGNDRNFIISGINSQYHTGITYIRHAAHDATTSLVVEVSSDGIIYTPVTFTQPGTNNTWTKITLSVIPLRPTSASVSERAPPTPRSSASTTFH